MSLIPGLGRSPGEGHGDPLQYSCLENPMDRGAWWATVHRVAESDTTEATQHTHTRFGYYKSIKSLELWALKQGSFVNVLPFVCISFFFFLSQTNSGVSFRFDCHCLIQEACSNDIDGVNFSAFLQYYTYNLTQHNCHIFSQYLA